MWIVNFFKWLWDGLVRLFQFVTTLPGLAIAGVTSVFTGLSTIFGYFSSSSTVIDAVSTHGDSLVNEITSTVSAGGSWLQLVFYSLSVDLLFNVLLNLTTLAITLTLALLTFFLVTVPAFILYYYGLKLTAFVATSLFPNSWVPSAIKEFGSFKGTHLHRLIGNNFIIQNDFEKK